jgi:hypothetical protein
VAYDPFAAMRSENEESDGAAVIEARLSVPPRVNVMS